MKHNPSNERICQSPEEWKAWSQNLGHEKVLTTFTSYGEVQPQKQSEIFQAFRKPRTDQQDNVQKIARAVAMELIKQNNVITD